MNCSSLATTLVRRAAFDIGSGAMKLQVADVVLLLHAMQAPIVAGQAPLPFDYHLAPLLHVVESVGSSFVHRIEKVVFGEEHPVMLGDDLNKSINNCLSAEIRATGLTTISRLVTKATELGCTTHSMAGIATAVFRRAHNGKDYLDDLQEQSGVKLELVSQEEEARLGYITARTLTPSPDGAVVWDSGGGSFQITGTAATYLGPFGASGATKMCVEEVQAKDYESGISPNPMSLSDANQLIRLIQHKLSSVPGGIGAADIVDPPPWIATAPIVLGIGGPNAIFCLASEVLGGQAEYTAAEIRSAISKVVGHTDNELAAQWCTKDNSDPPKFVVTKLCLLCAVMELLHIRRVRFVPVIGCCAGVLVSEKYFPAE
eukprot:m.232502 g.232502  ORF g.232502 m.232502 type:complete len:373 (-) comp19277_c0_seq2:244-1362(-)